jgi:hypothetical protein
MRGKAFGVLVRDRQKRCVVLIEQTVHLLTESDVRNRISNLR